MKKLLLTLTIAAFAVAVQAGEGKACCKDKDKAACAGKDKAACASKTGASAHVTCPKAQAAKRWLMSPKAAGELASAK